MPISKGPPLQTPLWKTNAQKAQRQEVRKTAYEPKGEKYTGEWAVDKRSGKGTCVDSKGRIYEGDWADGMRQGYGVKSVLRDGVLCKEYSGGWAYDKKEGYGANYYSNGEIYEGEYFDGKRSGWGRMQYSDGSIYEGEWFEGKRSGTGLIVVKNGNRYEGAWKHDLKHGDGKYFYLDKGQVYTGTWVDGTAKCGTFEDLQREYATNPTQYPLPELGVKVPDEILAKARDEHLGVVPKK